MGGTVVCGGKGFGKGGRGEVDFTEVWMGGWVDGWVGVGR